MNKFKSLRMEFTLILVVFVIIALATSTLFIRSSVNTMVINTEDVIKTEGKKIADVFSDTLVEESLISSEQQLAVLNDVLENYFAIPELAVNIMINDYAVKAAGADLSPELEERSRQTLANVREQSDTAVMFLYMGYADKRTFTATGWETPDYDPTSRPWYQAAVANPGELIWTAPYVDFATGALVITAAHTVEDDNGDIVGVIGADVSLASLQDMLNAYSVGETGYVIATDSTGIVLNHPADVGVTDPEEFQIVGKEIPIPELKTYVDSDNRSVTRINYVYNDDDKIAVLKKVDGIDATIMAMFSKSDVIALADESRNNFELFRVDLQNYIETTQDRTIQNVILISLGLMVVLGGLGYIYSNKVARPIASLTNDMQTISSGDFKSSIETKANSKEIHQAIEGLRSLKTSLGNIVLDVIALSDEIHSSTEELIHSGRDLSESSRSVTAAVGEIAQGATSQASDTEESARAMGSLSTVIQSLIEFNEVQTNQTATMNASSEKGLQAISTLDTKTNETIGILKETNDKTNELVSVVGQITGITETINSIAEQTNLLALNASIEAARAGEAGRGFAVVADEIRKLAEETSHSTGRIAQMIEQIENTSDEVVTAISSLERISAEQIDANRNVIDEFDGIKNGLEEMISMIDDSSSKVHEIDAGKTDVIEKIDNIVAITEETAAAAEEVNASIDNQDESIQYVLDLSTELSNKADRLSDQLKKFKV